APSRSGSASTPERAGWPGWARERAPRPGRNHVQRASVSVAARLTFTAPSVPFPARIACVQVQTGRVGTEVSQVAWLPQSPEPNISLQSSPPTQVQVLAPSSQVKPAAAPPVPLFNAAVVRTSSGAPPSGPASQPETTTSDVRDRATV